MGKGLGFLKPTSPVERPDTQASFLSLALGTKAWEIESVRHARTTGHLEKMNDFVVSYFYTTMM